MNAVLTFLNQNWFLLVVIISVIVIAVRTTKKFSELPSEEQQKKVLEWLLYAVSKAEKEMGSGTGKLKLRMVYDWFLDKFPSIAPVVSFDQFSKWVDIALEEMKKAIESNPKFREYVEGGSEDGSISNSDR